jgi:hypothetical protein
LPNQPKTKNRVVRVPDELWDAARAKAAERGEVLSEVIRGGLDYYVREANDMKREPECTCTIDGTYWPAELRVNPQCPIHGRVDGS